MSLVVGDLAYVQKGHCALDEAAIYGIIGTVEKIDSLSPWEHFRCPHCQEAWKYSGTITKFRDGWHPTAWLKRIPPLNELEEKKEEVEA